MPVAERTLWRRIGVTIPAGADNAAMIESAGLGWNVSKRRICMETDVGSTPIDGYYAIRRDDTLAPLGVVRKVYEPIQNADAFKFFEPAVRAGELAYETAGTLGGGKRVWIQALVSGAPVLADIDPVKAYLLLCNSHDGTMKLTVGFTPERIICGNMLNSALGGLADPIRIKHTGTAEVRLAGLQEVVRTVLSMYQKMDGTFRRMVDRKMTAEERVGFFDTVAPGKGKQAQDRRDRFGMIIASEPTIQPQFRETLWGAFNAVTFYVDHELVEQRRIKDPLTSLWFGSGATVRNRAISAAMRLIAPLPTGETLTAVTV